MRNEHIPLAQFAPFFDRQALCVYAGRLWSISCLIVPIEGIRVVKVGGDYAVSLLLAQD